MAPNHLAIGSVPQTQFLVGQCFNPFRLFTGIFIPEAMVRCPDLSPSAKLAYGRLVRYAGEDGRCFPAVNTLAREIGLKERRARCCLAELESAGFIRRDIQPGRTTAFVFLWHQVFAGGAPPGFRPAKEAPGRLISLYGRDTLQGAVGSPSKEPRCVRSLG